MQKPIPKATKATWRAAVQELGASAACEPTKEANPVLSVAEGSSSKRFTFGPVVIQPDRRESAISAVSYSVMYGS